jgi:hypothetical protein
MKAILPILCAAFLASSALAAATDAELKAAEAKVRGLVKTERLAKDLRLIADEFDRETDKGKEDEKTLEEYSRGALERVERLRRSGGLDAQLLPVLDRLEALFRELPSKTYARSYAGSLVRAVAEELRWACETGPTIDAALGLLEENLALPAGIPQDGEADALGFFPEDVPLSKFKKLGPIRVFLMKHRLKRPKSHARTTAVEVISAKHNVQVGVELEGVVTRTSKNVDQDYTFNFGDLHMEITPEWRLLHRKMPLPKKGQKVRVKGWTYFDKFHGSELEYDPKDPVMGANRVTVWEIHPVQGIEVLGSPRP